MIKSEYIVDKRQNFEPGRIINFTVCSNCDLLQNCKYLECPNKNYAVKMKKRKKTIDEIVEAYKDVLYESVSFGEALEKDSDLINDFMDCFTFPKNIHWQLTEFNFIEIQVLDNRTKTMRKVGSIDTYDGEKYKLFVSQIQSKLIDRIKKAIDKINSQITLNKKEII